jgi:hypothetical protein
LSEKTGGRRSQRCVGPDKAIADVSRLGMKVDAGDVETGVLQAARCAAGAAEEI